jgi:hypothetical protein
MPTLTSRNAIRHVMTHHKLPAALGTQSLCSLANHMKQRVQQHRDIAEEIFNATPIALDIQSGSMVIQPPAASEFLSRLIRSDADRTEARNTAALYLERLANLITPREAPSLGQFSTGIDHIWPSLRIASTAKSATPAANTFTEISYQGTQPDSFCVHGVWFRPISALSHEETHYISPALPRAPSPACWHLQRQPPTPQERSNPSALITIPPNTNTQTWHLFDNRWWISLTNPHPTHAYIIRFFTKADIPQLKTLPSLPPLKIDGLRLTIPALFLRKQCDDSASPDFPTPLEATTPQPTEKIAVPGTKTVKPAEEGRKQRREKETQSALDETFIGFPSLCFYPQPPTKDASIPIPTPVPCPPLSATQPQHKHAITVHYKAIDVKSTLRHIITDDLPSAQERQRKEEERKARERKNKFAAKLSRRNNGGIAGGTSTKKGNSKPLWAQVRRGRKEMKERKGW